MKIGYASGCKTPLQTDAFAQMLTQAGCDQISIDSQYPDPSHITPALDDLLQRLTALDILVVPALSHLGYSIPDLRLVLDHLSKSHAHLISLETDLQDTPCDPQQLITLARSLSTFTGQRIPNPFQPPLRRPGPQPKPRQYPKQQQ